MNMEPSSSLISDPVKKRKKRKQRRRYKPTVSRQRDKRGDVRCREQKRRSLMRRRFLSAWIDAANPLSSSSSGDPPVVEFTLSEKDTTGLPPCPSPVEFLITDECVKVCLPQEIPAEILDAHIRHHLSGQGGISPIVRLWCMNMFRQIYPEKSFPDVPCFDFDFIS